MMSQNPLWTKIIHAGFDKENKHIHRDVMRSINTANLFSLFRFTAMYHRHGVRESFTREMQR